MFQIRMGDPNYEFTQRSSTLDGIQYGESYIMRIEPTFHAFGGGHSKKSSA